MSDEAIPRPGQTPQTPMQQQLATLPPTLPEPTYPVNPVDSAPVMAESFQPTPTALCDDTAMHFTQTVRTKVAQNLMQTGALTGNDPKQTALMLAVLKDMDQQALGKKRIQADQAQAGALGDVSAMMARVLDAVDPRTFGVSQGAAPVDVQARIVKEDPTHQAVPGEMAVNPGQLDYTSFVNKQRGLTPPDQES